MQVIQGAQSVRLTAQGLQLMLWQLTMAFLRPQVHACFVAAPQYLLNRSEGAPAQKPTPYISVNALTQVVASTHLSMAVSVDYH